jgi:cytochrome c553
MTMPRRTPQLLVSLSLALTLPLAAAPLLAAPAEASNAAELVDQNCVKCHGTEVYTRSDRKVTTLDGLKRQVNRCETSLQLQWFPEDVAAVTDYLNQQYYHFK